MTQCPFAGSCFKDTTTYTVISPNFVVWIFCRKAHTRKLGEITVFYSVHTEINESSKSVLICKRIYILKVYSIHWTLKKTQIPSDKIKLQKVNSFFLHELQLSQLITFNTGSLHELKHKVYPSKSVCGIFHFRFRLDFIKVYILVQQKAPTL